MTIRTFLLSLSSLCITCCTLGYQTPTTESEALIDNENGDSAIITLSNGMVVIQQDSIYTFEGDIHLSQRFIDRIDSLNRGRSANVNEGILFWPLRVIPYRFHPSVPSSSRGIFLIAMNQISSVSGVSFRPATTYDQNFIYFRQSNDGNYSSLGMIGGAQDVFIQSVNASVIVHELMHALGFHHEHCRNDRDNYILVNYSNIRPSKLHNFTRYSSGTDFGTFDFSSIMLYNPFTTDRTFVYNTSEPMMYKADGSTFTANNTTLSSGDIDALCNIYGPPFHRLEITERLLQDYYDGVNEIYRTEYSTEIAFYEDESCTIPASLTFDRLITIQSDILSGSSASQTIANSGYQSSIVIPAGTQRISLGSHENIDYTVQASPYNVYIWTQSIVNSHVSSKYTFIQ